MTHNKVIDSTNVIYSQGSLAAIDEFEVSNSNGSIIVHVTLLPPGVRYFNLIDPR